MAIDVNSMDVESGTKGLLAGAFGPAAAMKLDNNPIQLESKQSFSADASYQVASGAVGQGPGEDGLATRIILDPARGIYLPQDRTTGGAIIHQGPDRQGFKTTPFGPGRV